MNVEPYPIKTNDYKDDEITRVVMKHSNKGEYHTGFRDGRDVTVRAVLKIVDDRIAYYTSDDPNQAIPLWDVKDEIESIRDAIAKMKGDQE